MMETYYDVDQFGILEPVTVPNRVPARAPSPPDRSEALPAPQTSISGSGNTTALRDIVTLYVGDSAAEWYARAAVRKRQGRGLLDRDGLQQLAKNYVTPPGLLLPAHEGGEFALQILRDYRVLVLAAPSEEGGQFAAGLRLGYELQLQHDELVVREELVDSEFVLVASDMLVENESAVVIVDLRGSPDLVPGVRRALVEFTNELERCRSYLVLIVPHGLIGGFQEFLPGRVHELTKPSSIAVLARYLDGVDVGALVDSAGAGDQLEQLWPPQLKDLAELVVSQRTRGVDAAQALREAMEGQKVDLRAVIRAKQEEKKAEWLSLLLSAALLEGASPEHIVNAADKMLISNKLKVKSDVAPLLRPSAHARLQDLDMVAFEAESREFRSRGFGTQVLRHFWREHPALHKMMESWIGAIPRDFGDLSKDELERVADRTAELATEAGYLLAVNLAEEWASGSANTAQGKAADSYRRSVAVRLLITVATDTTLGRQTRDRLLYWSKLDKVDLQLLTADVCDGLGQSYPRIALTRLKHLANSDNKDVRTAVLDAVLKIGAELGTSHFLRYLSEWFDDATPPRLQTLSQAVSVVLSGQVETIDAEAAESFWQRALDVLPPEDLHSAVSTWLRATADMPAERQSAMVEPLVRATRSEYLRITQLQYASKFDRQLRLDLSPMRGHPVADVVALLWTRLDEVHPIWRQE